MSKVKIYYAHLLDLNSCVNGQKQNQLRHELSIVVVECDEFESYIGQTGISFQLLVPIVINYAQQLTDSKHEPSFSNLEIFYNNIRLGN